jgi:serine/threonine-protein kinase
MHSMCSSFPRKFASGGRLESAIVSGRAALVSGLPSIVSALEARAAEARAELDVVAALARPGSDDTAVLERRRGIASSNLAASVGALERIRLDLLKLHAGAGDLKPLTTLIEEAQLLSQEVARLAEAEQEVEDAIERRYS